MDQNSAYVPQFPSNTQKKKPITAKNNQEE